MELKDILKSQVAFVQEQAEGTIGDCSKEALSKTISGATIGSCAVVYAHMIFSEDGIVSGMLQGKAPIYHAQGWASKASVAMPENPRMDLEWGKTINMNLPAFQAYAKAVYAATDEYLSNLSEADLSRKLQTPFGESTVGFMLNVLVSHPATHTGEIAALKGVQGLKGLPF